MYDRPDAFRRCSHAAASRQMAFFGNVCAHAWSHRYAARYFLDGKRLPTHNAALSCGEAGVRAYRSAADVYGVL